MIASSVKGAAADTAILGASQFAAAAGLHPHTSRAELWRVLTGRKEPEVFNPEWLQAGVDQEAWAVQKASEITGIQWENTLQGQCSHYYGGLRATPDGIYRDARGTFVLEVKSPQHRMYVDIPPYYMPQLQGQLLVCQADEACFVAAMGTHVKAWWVMRSQAYIDELVTLLDDFLLCMEHDIEPPRLSKRPAMPEVQASPVQLP